MIELLSSHSQMIHRSATEWKQALTCCITHTGIDYRFAEVGTTINYDVENANNQNPVLHGYQLVRNILRTIERERPILSLGFPGFLITSGGLTFITLKLHQYLQTGTFPVEQAFVSAFAILIGIFACFTAIILHSLEQLPQRQSEEGRAH